MDSAEEKSPAAPHVGQRHGEGADVIQLVRLGASVFAVRERDGRQEWRVLRRG